MRRVAHRLLLRGRREQPPSRAQRGRRIVASRSARAAHFQGCAHKLTGTATTHMAPSLSRDAVGEEVRWAKARVALQ